MYTRHDIQSYSNLLIQVISVLYKPGNETFTNGLNKQTQFNSSQIDARSVRSLLVGGGSFVRSVRSFNCRSVTVGVRSVQVQ